MTRISHHASLSVYVCAHILYYIGCHYFPFNWTVFCLAPAYWTFHQPCINFTHGSLVRCLNQSRFAKSHMQHMTGCVYWKHQNKETIKKIISHAQVHFFLNKRHSGLKLNYDDSWSTKCVHKRFDRCIKSLLYSESYSCQRTILFQTAHLLIKMQIVHMLSFSSTIIQTQTVYPIINSSIKTSWGLQLCCAYTPDICADTCTHLPSHARTHKLQHGFTTHHAAIHARTEFEAVGQKYSKCFKTILDWSRIQDSLSSTKFNANQGIILHFINFPLE